MLITQYVNMTDSYTQISQSHSSLPTYRPPFTTMVLLLEGSFASWPLKFQNSAPRGLAVMALS